MNITASFQNVNLSWIVKLQWFPYDEFLLEGATQVRIDLAGPGQNSIRA